MTTSPSESPAGGRPRRLGRLGWAGVAVPALLALAFVADWAGWVPGAGPGAVVRADGKDWAVERADYAALGRHHALDIDLVPLEPVRYGPGEVPLVALCEGVVAAMPEAPEGVAGLYRVSLNLATAEGLLMPHGLPLAVEGERCRIVEEDGLVRLTYPGPLADWVLMGLVVPEEGEGTATVVFRRRGEAPAGLDRFPWAFACRAVLAEGHPALREPLGRLDPRHLLIRAEIRRGWSAFGFVRSETTVFAVEDGACVAEGEAA